MSKWITFSLFYYILLSNMLLRLFYLFNQYEEINNGVLQHISSQLCIQWHHIGSLKVVQGAKFTPQIWANTTYNSGSFVVKHLPAYYSLDIWLYNCRIDTAVLCRQIHWKFWRTSLRKDISWIKLPHFAFFGFVLFFCLIMWYVLVWWVLNPVSWH